MLRPVRTQKDSHIVQLALIYVILIAQVRSSMRGKSVLIGAVLLLGSFPAAPTQPQPASSARQSTPQPPSQTQGRGQRGAPLPMDPERAQRLYVSNDPKDHSKPNYQAQIEAKARTDARFADACKGVIDFKQVKYRSSVGDLDIPAYIFQPLQTRGPKGHAALVWVHGGVHSNQSETMFPFIKEAVDRGYVVIAPDYRGSTG